MIVLIVLKAIDWIVPFTRLCHRLIADVLPNVLLKSGDYQPNQIAGNKEA
ncbi:hypothetical protein [Candidatus Gullanella endobia]|nr:hypothetical protein [Candidatus Gullanella endobia]